MPDLNKILKLVELGPTLREWIECQQSAGIELEDTLTHTRITVEDPKAPLEDRVWAAAVGVVAVEMIREERRADGCEG